MLFTNRSTENLSDKPQDSHNSNNTNGGSISPVQLRDPMVKPAIPERPVSLMRANNFKGTATTPDPPQQFAGGESPLLKKTPSFRGTIAGQLPPLNGQTTLERTHIYNVDKKQVAIIDFVDSTKAADSQTKSSTTTTMAASAPAASIVTATLKIRTDAEPTAGGDSTSNAAAVGGTVPPSPRGFDPKIKRPQIPAPPPPTAAAGATVARPKSESGDSTQL